MTKTVTTFLLCARLLTSFSEIHCKVVFNLLLVVEKSVVSVMFYVCNFCAFYYLIYIASVDKVL